MTYISKKEKVFELPEQETDNPLPTPKRSDHRLKRFPSVNDRRAWTLEECERYQHLYGLVSGSEMNIAKTAAFKYIPFDVMLTILMAEKDAYIQQLLEKQEDLSKINVVENKDALIRKDAEVIALKNKIASLESQLEECRDTLRNSIQKLENFEDVINENAVLRKKLKKEEGMGDGRSKIPISVHSGGDGEIIRNNKTDQDLLNKIQELENQLKQSESTTKELTTENETYKKKLEDMKCLEKFAEDMKVQAHNLTDKYKRASQKINEQTKQINNYTSDIQALTEERNSLNKRLGELEKYESERFVLEKKLQQVELIINENESLNVKVLNLGKLRAENEELKSTVEKLKIAEKEADGGRERILQLQNAISEQENEIKNLFSQIENLLSLKSELEEKNNKIVLYEKQLSEIPFMEAEIEKLRGKLEKYEEDLRSERDLLRNLKSELNICRRRCSELQEMGLVLPISSKTNEEAETEEKESENEIVILKAPNDENQSGLLKASSCGIIELKEPSNLTCASSEISVSYSEDMKQIKQEEYDSLCREIDDLRKMIDKKYCRIEELEAERVELLEKLNRNGEESRKVKDKIQNLNLDNEKLTGELKESSNRINQIEKLLEVEQKARKFAENLTKQSEEKYLQELIERRKLEDLSKLQKEEFNLAKSELEKNSRKKIEGLKAEMENLKMDVEVLKKLNEDLKTENSMLREEIDFVRQFEAKKAEESFAARLRSELDNLWSLPKSEMEKECESLREKLKESAEELEDLKTALDYEKNLKTDSEKSLKIEKEIVENKEKIIGELLKTEEDLKSETEKFKETLNRLQRENKCLQDNILNLSESIKNNEKEITEKTGKIEELTEKIKSFEKLLQESRELNEKICKEAEAIKKEKDSENLELISEITRLKSENEVLNGRLEENKLEVIPKINYEEDLQEKFAIEEALRKIEAELDELKGKSSECQVLMEELTILKENKKSLMIKVTDFEAKIEMLKNNPFEEKNIIEALLSCNKSVSCSPLSPVMSIEEHKKIVQEVENRHKSEMEKAKENHEEKIKILIEKYQKEEKIRGKSYNDAVNSLKSNYETDIRKLTEKHKASINRLQELHEDEVQELNTNYETQMEAMQTQNENIINDLTAKAKSLTEEHNSEVKNLEDKFQRLIQEKEALQKAELTNLKSRLTENVENFNENRQSELEVLKGKYENKIAELEEKHLNEIKKIKKNNLKKMDTFKLKYDDLLAEERKKCEEILLDRLRRGQQGDLNFDGFNKKEDSSEMFKIFKKMLTQGLETLTINERVLIHCRICLTVKGMGIGSETKSASEPSIGDTCSNTSIIKADRELLLQRIYILENEVAHKEFENQENIANLEKAEKNQTHELKTALQSEIQKNAELKKKLSDHLKSQTDDKLEKYLSDRQENEFMEKMKELEKEKTDKKNVEELLQNERHNVKRLTEILENEIARFKAEKKQDGELIESMKLRLDEAISNEQIIESQLNYEASTRAKLQSDLESLQKSLNLIVESPPQFPSDTKTAKDIKNLDQSKSIKSDKKIRSKSKSKTRRKT